MRKPTLKIMYKGPIHLSEISTPLGKMIAGATQEGICLLDFKDRKGLRNKIRSLQERLNLPITPFPNRHIDNLQNQLDEYFSGHRLHFDLPLILLGTEFQTQVWKALRRIPYGKTRSYSKQALSLGNAKSVRAVAKAIAENRIMLLIPCHRVIGSNGKLVGYAGGLWRKKHILEFEKRSLESLESDSRIA